MTSLSTRKIEVWHRTDAGEAQQMAKTMAKALNFDDKACEEIAIAVSELAANLLDHAQGGTIVLTPLAQGDRSGLQVEAVDTGPGIEDVEQAMKDGFTTSDGLGFGLGAVNRLMDEFEIASQPGEGTHVICKRWIRVDAPLLSPNPLEFGVATRSHPMTDVNGDTFAFVHWGGNSLVAVIDGVGHGRKRIALPKPPAITSRPISINRST